MCIPLQACLLCCVIYFVLLPPADLCPLPRTPAPATQRMRKEHVHLGAAEAYLELTLNIPGRKGKGSSRVNIAFGMEACGFLE